MRWENFVPAHKKGKGGKEHLTGANNGQER